MTIFAILALLVLLYVCGLGPTLLLMGPEDSPRRIAVMPLLGMCAFTFFVLPLAQLNLMGATICPIALVFFSALAVIGYRRGSRLTRKELRISAPAILLGRSEEHTSE